MFALCALNSLINSLMGSPNSWRTCVVKYQFPQREHNGTTARLKWYHLLLLHYCFPIKYTKGKLARKKNFPSQKKLDLLESKGLSSCLIALECQQKTLPLIILS